MKVGFRSVTVFGTLLALSTGLLWFGKLDSTQWVSLTQWTFAPLMAGLAANHFGSKV